MTTRLTPEQQQKFHRDGYFLSVPVLSDAEVRKYLAKYMEYAAQNKDRLASLPANQKYQVLSQMHFVMPWVYEMVSNPRVLDAVESVLGPNLLVWDTSWFSKMPGEKTYVSWHQDGTYWNLTPTSGVVSAWIALTPCGPANGCLRVIPGTHTKPFMPQRETHVPDNALSRGQEIAVTVDENNAVDLVLEPGHASLHHIWIVHGSNANNSTTPRIGLAIRFVQTKVKQESPGKPMAILVRGRDDDGNFELMPPPTSEDFTANAQTHRMVIDRVRKSILVPAK